MLRALREALADPNGGLAEVEVGPHTFCFKPVATPEFDFVTVYAMDITAARAVERFPERNPNPVLRVTTDGALMYANAASAPIVTALALSVGEALPGDLWEQLVAAEATGSEGAVTIQGDGRWYELVCVPIPEMNFINVYGNDVTARRALQRFPLQNPNPVVRVAHDGTLLFANPASDHLVAAFGLEVGEPLPALLMEPLPRSLFAHYAIRTVPTLIACRSSRVGWMTTARPTRESTTSLYRTDAR